MLATASFGGGEVILCHRRRDGEEVGKPHGLQLVIRRAKRKAGGAPPACVLSLRRKPFARLLELGAGAVKCGDRLAMRHPVLPTLVDLLADKLHDRLLLRLIDVSEQFV